LSKLLGNLKEGRIFIISAPAGTGKTTLVEMLTKEFSSVVRSVTCTTRHPRPGEVEGRDYFFLTDKEFDEKLKKGDFLEHATVFGHRYGSSKEMIDKELKKGRHVVLILDTQGALWLKKKMEATFIFISPPSLEKLRERLLKRKTETQEKIEERIKWASHELEQITHYDYLIVNDDLEIAYTVLKSIFIAREHKLGDLCLKNN
jgi:guanylate kinase